jgi:hypothetical protein
VAFEHLQDLLPAGAVMTEVTQPDGQPAVNVRTDLWQAAIPLTGDGDQDEWAIVAQAWSQQAHSEHRQRMEAMHGRYQAEERQLREQFFSDMDTKIRRVKARHEARKAQVDSNPPPALQATPPPGIQEEKRK